jgi:hypothetical protein
MKKSLLTCAALLAFPLAASDAHATTFDFTGSIVDYTVPIAGTYDIIAYGAQGGAGISPGGKGAVIGGLFALSTNEILRVLVGRAGGPGIKSPPLYSRATGQFIYGFVAGGGGGGGGSFVIGPNNKPLIVAGGGGGGGGGSSFLIGNTVQTAVGVSGGGGLVGQSGVENPAYGIWDHGFSGGGGGGGNSEVDPIRWTGIRVS